MKIVVLDGYALNPGDNPWDEIAALGELAVYERTSPESLMERARGAGILLTNKTVLGGETIAALPELGMIGVLATGYNSVDTAAAAERGIPVCNVPAYSTDSVSQLVMAFVLEFCHNAAGHADSVKAGDWCRAADYSYWLSPLIELRGKTMGIIGFGTIGRRTAELAHAFGMKILAYNTSPKPAPDYGDFAFAELDEVLSQSDFITLHCPLTDKNRGMINEKSISGMKKTAFLINTARGPLIDEQALSDALNSGKIAGAAVDVLSSEPPRSDNPLLKAKNIIITPHIAWATLEARRRLMTTAAENIKAFLAGNAQNVVNGVN